MDETEKKRNLFQPKKLLSLFIKNLPKVIMSIPSFTIMFCVGLSYSTLPSTIALLEEKNDNAGFTYSMRAFGLLFGSVLGGLLIDILQYFYSLLEKRIKNRILRYFLLQIFSINGCQRGLLVFLSVLFFLVPFINDLTLMLTNFFFIGFCLGSIEVGSTLGIVQIWETNQSPPLQFMHFVFSVGVLVEPSIVSIFLSFFDNEESLLFSYIFNSGIPLICSLSLIIPPPQKPKKNKNKNNNNTPKEEEEKMEETVVIEEIILEEGEEEKEKEKEEEEEESSPLSPFSTFLFWLFVTIVLSFILCSDCFVSYILVVYLVDQDLTSMAEATRLLSYYSIVYVFGRLLCTLLSLFLSPIIEMTISCIGAIFCGFFLMLFPYNLPCIYFFFILSSVFLAPMYPTNYSIPKHSFNIDSTGFTSGIALIATSFAIALPSLLNWAMKTTGIYELLWYSNFLSVALTFLFFLLQLALGVLWTKKKSDLKHKLMEYNFWNVLFSWTNPWTSQIFMG